MEKMEDVKKEIIELVGKVVGKLNSFDSKKDRADETLTVLNSIIAGVELSKIEKAGTLTYLLSGRLK